MRMAPLPNPEEFVGETLADIANTVKIDQDLFELIKIPRQALGLRAGHK